MSCSLQEHTELLDGWSTDSDSYGSDFTPDEAELLSDLIDSADKHGVVAKTEIETATFDDSRRSPIPDIEDHAYLRLALGEAAVADTGVEEYTYSGGGFCSIPFEFLLLTDGCGDKRLAPGRGSQVSRRAQDKGESESLKSDGSDWKRPVLKPVAKEEKEESVTVQKEGEEEEVDTRSPLDRFRRPPAKGLSVSDLVAPSWCELQYWYTLTTYGWKRRTPAMKRGTVVHRILENEVHTSVPVEVATKEEVWALRIWNMIYGLRTLRDTGLTRELEVWGKVDGEIVIGVIDMLSYECPDEELEASMGVGMGNAGVKSTNELPVEESADNLYPNIARAHADEDEGDRRIYLTDVKTRDLRGRGVPALESSSFRPAMMQLQLYYHFLSRLIESDDITIEDIATRFDLKTDKPLSDAFLAQVGTINDDYFDTEACSWTQSQDNEPPSSTNDSTSERQDSLTVLLNHNSLSNLWDLLKENLRLTFLHYAEPTQTPTQDTEPTSLLSPILTVSYMSPASKKSRSKSRSRSRSQSPDTEDIPTESQLQSQAEEYMPQGSRSFIFDPQSLYPYLADGMQWWRGKRPARGVHESEAWKCQICDFKDGCSWREEMFETHLKEVKARKAAGR
ncbi:hypothetical protein FQN49_003462 [Arthroderma sp. PD_2]|nr:hypothetical protein FQN49_003462 [Arthroderma sp. PD_2]